MDAIEEIKKLKALLDQGAITEEEFQRLKSDLFSNNQQSSFEDSSRESRQDSKVKKGEGLVKKRKGLIPFIITLLVFSIILLIGGFLIKNDIIRLNLNILSNHKENVNSSNLDTLKMFDNIIYEKGSVVGKLVIVEFVTKSNQFGRVFNVPDGKMWTPLYFEYKDFGKNYYITLPKILTEQNKNSRIGRDYYSMHIYDDPATKTWWEKETGFYFPKQEDFKSIKLSMRNRKAISGKNAIHINGYERNVNYKFYFFEESIR